MIRSFRHKGLAKFFATGSVAGIRPEHAKRLRWILAQMNAATTVAEVAAPGLRLHPLKGGRAGFYALDVSGNWRVTFRFEGTDALDVDYLDYH